MKISAWLLTFLIHSQLSIGQSVLIQKIRSNAYELITDSAFSNRQNASDSLNVLIADYLDKYLNDIKALDDIKGLSYQSSSDGQVVVLSWELFEDVGESQYFGQVFNAKLGKIWTLKDDSKNLDELDYDQLSVENWYGALYYDMVEVRDNSFLLFGYDNYTSTSKRKLVEVLTFEDGELIFGAPMFGDKDENYRYYKYRFIYDYSVETAALLRYEEELQAIRFDHLISVRGSRSNRGSKLVPDGTFSGYLIEDGYCYFVEDFSKLEKSK